MAKTKKPKKAATDYTDPAEHIIQNGVEISRKGNDRGPAHMWKNGRNVAEDLVVEEIQIAARQQKARLARRVDVLERLYSRGSIDLRGYDASVLFQEDFYKAQLIGYPPTKLMWSPASTAPRLPGETSSNARDKINRCMKAMDKQQAAAGAAWEIIGNCKTFKELGAYSYQERALYEALLVIAIDYISEVYQPSYKK